MVGEEFFCYFFNRKKYYTHAAAAAAVVVVCVCVCVKPLTHTAALLCRGFNRKTAENL